MDILFLDFDGPLKTIENYHQATQMGFYKFNEKCVENLNRILEVTAAKIVVTSSWKAHLDYLRAIFEKNGIEGRHIIDITPSLKDKIRGDEIQEWLDTMGKYFNRKGGKYKIGKFMILDDDRDMGHLQPYLIQTYYTDGITNEIADIAIEYLTLDKPITKLRYITAKDQHERATEWERNLSIVTSSSVNKDSIELMKVSHNIMNKYERDIDYTTLCYNHRFQEITVKTRPEASITKRTVL